jgi:acyl-CoA thioesterase
MAPPSPRSPSADVFAADSAVEALGDGAYRGTIDGGWFGPPGPNGGFIAAIVLRAIRAEIADDARLPRSLTLHYLRPPHAGEARIEVTVERSGRTATTCAVRLTQDDKLTTIALCVLTTAYEGMAEWTPQAPRVPAPEQVPELDLWAGAPPLFERLETRPCFGPPPFSGGDEAVTGGWIRARGSAELAPELIALYTDAWWPAPFGILDGPSAAPTLELTIHFRAQPTPSDRHALVRFRSRASIDGLFDEEGEVWSRNGRLLATSKQIALLRPWPSP